MRARRSTTWEITVSSSDRTSDFLGSLVSSNTNTTHTRMMCISCITCLEIVIKYKLTLKLQVKETNDKYIINKISWIKNKNTIQIFRLTKRKSYIHSNDFLHHNA